MWCPSSVAEFSPKVENPLMEISLSAIKLDRISTYIRKQEVSSGIKKK
jgi:hypothetical protein